MADRQRCIKIFGAILLAAVAAAADLGPDLRDAARKGQTRQVAALLDRGAPIESADKDGRTALLYAAQRGHAETVKLLLDRGAKPDARDRQGWTAYALALLNGRDEVVKVLPPQRPVTLELVVTWAPDNLYSSCSLTPQQLADRIAALQLDVVTAAAVREYAVTGGKGAAQFPAEGADATLEVKVRPGVSCLQQ